jgi:hypothetical protein
MVRILGKTDYVMRVLHNCGASSQICGVPINSLISLGAQFYSVSKSGEGLSTKTEKEGHDVD